jgi:hypothetical protein
MFRNLTDLQYKRNFKEAVGFYLAYLLLLMALAAMISGVSSLFSNSDDPYELGVRIGTGIGCISCFLLAILIIN